MKTSVYPGLPRISGATPQALDELVASLHEPVILTGALDEWPAASRWSAEYLMSACGSRSVRVVSSDNGRFDYADGRAVESAERSFAEAVSLIGEPGPNFYYIQQLAIDQNVPELLSDIRIPPCIDQGQIEANLWFGTAGNISPLHFDWSNNLLCQLTGRKIITVFDPVQSDLLYPHPLTAPMPHVSRVDIEHPDYAAYPLFAEASGFQDVLSAGEVLLLPAGWWHDVRSVEVSISVNLWWPLRGHQLFVPNLLRSVRNVYDANRLESLRANFGPGLDSFMAYARYAVSKGVFWAAALFVGAALEDDLRMVCRRHQIEDRSNGDRLLPIEELLERLAEVDRRVRGQTGALRKCFDLVARAKSDGQELVFSDALSLITKCEQFFGGS
jgi:hypothetical protein